jgi:hypothetical protein
MKLQPTFIAVALISLGSLSLAHAEDQPAGTAPVSTTPEGVKVTEDGIPMPPAEEAPGAEFGVGIRLRNVRMPEGILELFVDKANGASSEAGLGLDFIRRKENFELQIGLEYEKISVAKGIWVQKNAPIPGNEADLVEFNGFGWVSLEANFISHHDFTDSVALRYGGGAGIGILFGNVTHQDRACTTTERSSCTIPTNGDVKIKYDLKSPVYPVITGLLGVQYRPTKKMTINLEGGIRAPLLFFGVSAAYFF